MSALLLSLITVIFCGLPALADSNYGLDTVAKGAYGSNLTLQNDPVVIIGLITGVVLSLLGVIFLVQIVIAGITWMTSSGNEEKITKAKASLLHSAIGLIIVVGAYAIVSRVLQLALLVVNSSSTTPGQ